MAAGCSQRLSIIKGDRIHPAVIQLGSVCFPLCMVPGLAPCSRLNRFAVGFVIALGLLAAVEVGYNC